MGRQRNNQICVRLSDAEYEDFLHKLQQTDLTQNDFFRRLISEANIPSSEQSAELKKLNESIDGFYKQIRGIGTNLNQLTRIANQQIEIPALAVLQGTAHEIEKMRQELNRVWELIRQEIKK